MTESVILKAVLVRATRLGARLFRNNVGVAVYPDGSRVVYGLCPGSADTIGWRTITVTPEMVGRTIAQFVAIETKGPKGRTSPEQANFLARVQEAGGIAAVVRAPEEIDPLLQGDTKS